MIKLRMPPPLINVAQQLFKKIKRWWKYNDDLTSFHTHPVLRIRIHMDPFHFGKPKPDPDSGYELKWSLGGSLDHWSQICNTLMVSWIRIRIKVNSRIRIRINMKRGIRIRIRIRIVVFWIRNTGFILLLVIFNLECVIQILELLDGQVHGQVENIEGEPLQQPERVVKSCN
jgi:hypothetical protein